MSPPNTVDFQWWSALGWRPTATAGADAGRGGPRKAAGCAGYLVSFLGRRVLYFGRSAGTHVEHFPKM